jgi:hypothetical protein
MRPDARDAPYYVWQCWRCNRKYGSKGKPDKPRTYCIDAPDSDDPDHWVCDLYLDERIRRWDVFNERKQITESELESAIRQHRPDDG